MSAKKYLIVCYNEELLINYIENNKEYILEYAYIKHQPEEEEKKQHYHFFIEFHTPKNKQPIAKSLGINEILVQSCRNKKNTFKYFIHKDNPNKIQYNLEDIITNIDMNILYCITQDSVETEEEYLNQQIEYFEIGMKLTDLIKLSIEDRNLDKLRRYWNIIKYYYENTLKF